MAIISVFFLTVAVQDFIMRPNQKRIRCSFGKNKGEEVYVLNVLLQNCVFFVLFSFFPCLQLVHSPEVLALTVVQERLCAPHALVM